MYRLFTKQMYENPAPFHGIYVLFKDVKLTHVYHDVSLTLCQKKIINLYSLNWFRSTMIIINKNEEKIQENIALHTSFVGYLNPPV